jgi:group I intron endonuclease
MIVYLIKNIVNGKSYVGMTTRTLATRWAEHVAASKDADRKDIIYNAIRMYGVDNFEVSTLEECSSLEQLKEREIFWINQLKTFAPLNKGYNSTLGGEGTVGYRHSDDVKERIRQANIGRYVSEYMRVLMSEKQKKAHENPSDAMLRARKEHSNNIRGERNPFYGKSWGRTGPPREETKRKLSDAHKGKQLSEEHKSKILESVHEYYSNHAGPNRGVCYPIACYNVDDKLVALYRNYDEASRALKTNVKLLRKSAVCCEPICGFRLIKLHKHTSEEFDSSVRVLFHGFSCK